MGTSNSRPNTAQLQAQVDAWNAAFPIGARVTVRKDDGTTTATTTRSAAWVAGGHSAVILLDGISGYYLLDRVSPARAEHEVA